MDPALLHVLPRTAIVDGGSLAIGGVPVRELVERHGSPLVVYDEDDLVARARAWVDAASGWEQGALVAYASKAISTVGILRLLAREGLGADVASLGELKVALEAGVDPARIVHHGNNKSRQEVRASIRAGSGLLVLDSASELELVAAEAERAGRVQPVLVRVNPDIVVETHRYINTAHAGSKFGVPSHDAEVLLRRAEASAYLDPRGVHVHLGSQLLDLAPWRTVLEWLAGWAAELRGRTSFAIRTVDVGGGLGIAYTGEQDAPSPADVVATVEATVREAWQQHGLPLPSLIYEPGRSIVGPAAVTAYTVGVVKDAGDIRYANVDGGMSDNPRPTLYQASYSALLADRLDEPATGTWWIAGVHCESGDVLVEDALLPEPRPGDVLVVPATGAYGVSMSSTYNMVPRAAVVLVGGGRSRELLRRERIDDLLARDMDSNAAGRAHLDAAAAVEAAAVDEAAERVAGARPELGRAVVTAAVGAAAVAAGRGATPEDIAARTLSLLGEGPHGDPGPPPAPPSSGDDDLDT